MITILQLSVSTPYTDPIPSNSVPQKFRNFTIYCFFDHMTILFTLLRTWESAVIEVMINLCVGRWASCSVINKYKAVKLQQPSYLSSLLSPHRQSRVLRSSASDLLSTCYVSLQSSDSRHAKGNSSIIIIIINTVFIDKHCFSLVLMLRSYCLEQSAVICTLH